MHERLRPGLALLVVALALTGRAAGQGTSLPAAPASDPLLERLIEESLSARPELKQAQELVRAERERVPQAGALPDPTLSLGIQNDGFKEIMVGKMETSYYQVMLSQPLPWPGKLGLREDVATLGGQAGGDQRGAGAAHHRGGRAAHLPRPDPGARAARPARPARRHLAEVLRDRDEPLRGGRRRAVRPAALPARAEPHPPAPLAPPGGGAQRGSRRSNRLRGHPLDEPIETTAKVERTPRPRADAASRRPSRTRAPGAPSWPWRGSA